MGTPYQLAKRTQGALSNSKIRFQSFFMLITVQYGHKYSAQWSTEVPHLRNEYCAPNDLAERDYNGFEDEAEHAMLLKLENDGLI
jgi:hypothetical protein